MESIKYYIALVFGSDTQTGSTPAYVWLADQFGHVFIGFGGLFLALWLVSGIVRRPLPCYGFGAAGTDGRVTLPGRLIWIAAGLWAALWFAKELRDLSMAGDQTSHWLAVWNKDLIEDVATDMIFYLIGITLALAHFGMLRVRPIFIFLIALLLAGGLCGYWVRVFDDLGKTNIPHLARMSSVTLVPAPPSEGLMQTLNTAPLPPQCGLYEPKPQPALQCTMGGGCGRTHYIIYGLTEADMPTPPPQGTRGTLVGNYISTQSGEIAAKSYPKQQRIKKTLPELRKLGVALVAEYIFRKRDGDIYYTTLLNAVEMASKQKTLVIDNIERDLTRYALSLSPQFRDANFNDRTQVFETLFHDELGGWSKAFNEKSVIWLSFNESLAVALCRTLVQVSGEQSGDRVTLIRVGLSDQDGGNALAATGDKTATQ